MYYRNKDYENRAIYSEINQVISTYFNEEKYGKYNSNKIMQSQNLNREFESVFITDKKIYSNSEIDTLENLLKTNKLKTFFSSLSRIIEDLVCEIEKKTNLKDLYNSYLCNSCYSINKFVDNKNPNEKISVQINKKLNITNRINQLYTNKQVTFSIYSNLIKLIGVINRESNLCDDMYKVIGSNLIYYNEVDLNKKTKYLKEDGKEMIKILEKVFNEIQSTQISN